MLKRKLAEIGSILYRRLAFPFKRMAIEARTNSIMKQGSYLNKGTVLEGRNYVGKGTVLSNVRLGFGSYVSDGGDMSNTAIGRYTSIGPDVRTVLGKHPVDSRRAALHPAFNSDTGSMGFTYFKSVENNEADEPKKPHYAGNPGNTGAEAFEEAKYLDKENKIQIIIGSDVWIGQGVKILEGVTIGDGAVVGAGALVSKDLEPYGIYAGVPAKKLRERFDKAVADKLLAHKWWKKDEAWIRAHSSDFSDAEHLIATLEAER